MPPKARDETLPCAGRLHLVFLHHKIDSYFNQSKGEWVACADYYCPNRFSAEDDSFPLPEGFDRVTNSRLQKEAMDLAASNRRNAPQNPTRRTSRPSSRAASRAPSRTEGDDVTVRIGPTVAQAAFPSRGTTSSESASTIRRDPPPHLEEKQDGEEEGDPEGEDPEELIAREEEQRERRQRRRDNPPDPPRGITTLDNLPKSKKDPKLAAPERFDGDKTKFRKWWASVRLYIELKPEAFSEDKQKVAGVLSFMTQGLAAQWAQHQTEIYLDHGFHTYRRFKSLMEENFAEDLELEKAMDKVFKMTQAVGETIDKYNQTFGESILRSGITDKGTLIYHYKRGIHQGITAKIDTLDQSIHPTTIQEYMRKASEFDNNWRMHQAQ